MSCTRRSRLRTSCACFTTGLRRTGGSTNREAWHESACYAKGKHSGPATVGREAITRTHELIRPHIRRTPVIEVDGADFSLDGIRIVLKLELLQHAGSFK